MTKSEEKNTQVAGAALHSPEAVRMMKSRPPAQQAVPSREMMRLDARTRVRVGVAGSLVVLVLAAVLAVVLPSGMFGDPLDEAGSVSGTQELTTRGFLEMMVYADGWEADASTPAVLHVMREDGSTVLYHAVKPGDREIVELESGAYRVGFIPAINADGTAYRFPEAQRVQVDVGHTSNIAATLDVLPGDEATFEDYQAIIDAFEAAIAQGDATLRGATGDALRARLLGNAQAATAYQEQEAPYYYQDYGYGYDSYSYDYSWMDYGAEPEPEPELDEATDAGEGDSEAAVDEGLESGEAPDAADPAVSDAGEGELYGEEYVDGGDVAPAE